MASAVGGTFWIFLIVLWLPGLALVLMLQQARLTTTGDVLTYWVPPRTTRAWQREEIATFWLEPTWWSRAGTACIGMETVPGERIYFWAIDASRFADRDELHGWLAMLLDWLEVADE